VRPRSSTPAEDGALLNRLEFLAGHRSLNDLGPPCGKGGATDGCVRSLDRASERSKQKK